MDRLIELANRAVADYGFRQAVLYGSEDVSRRWELSEQEQAILGWRVLELLAILPVPVEPDDIPGEQARIAAAIRTAANS